MVVGVLEEWMNDGDGDGKNQSLLVDGDGDEGSESRDIGANYENLEGFKRILKFSF